jgi:hypothetical protein
LRRRLRTAERLSGQRDLARAAPREDALLEIERVALARHLARPLLELGAMTGADATAGVACAQWLAILDQRPRRRASLRQGGPVVAPPMSPYQLVSR